MERLKKFLRQAISQSAHRLKVQVGSPWEILLSSGPVPLDDGLPVDGAYLQQLYAAFLPTEQKAIAAQSLARGALNIPGQGRLLLIAQPSPPASLRIYLPPQGLGLFESDWQRLSSATVPPGVSPGSSVPGTIDPRNLFASPAGEQGFAPSVVHHESKPTEAAQSPVRVEEPTPASQGFIPPFLTGGAGSPRIDVMEKPASYSVPSVAGAAPKLDNPAFGAPLAPSQSQVTPSKSVNSSPVSSGPVESPLSINFDADAVGDGGFSEGYNVIDPILSDMVKRRASDLHLTCGEALCMRIDGEIERIGQQPLTPKVMESYILPILPPRNHKEIAEANDTDFAYDLRGVARFRVNVFRDKNGIGAVMRQIPATILTAEKLSLSPAILKFCNLTKGLVLVTGPTGSGKSTTLAAMIDLINKTRADHILTIEDPIEFVHPQQKCLVNQREVHRHTKSFARALKAALREDPDIILIGEMRDLETIAIAIETAETGHLVFGTLHTTTAVSTVDRIIDQFPADRQAQIRTMLASSLKGVVAQTLLKKKGGGRVAAHEILVVSDPVSAMIREGKNHMIPNHMQTQKADGNQLLNEALLKLVKDSVVDVDDAMRKSVDKNTFADMLRRAGIKWGEPQAAAPGQPSPAGRPSPKSA